MTRSLHLRHVAFAVFLQQRHGPTAHREALGSGRWWGQLAEAANGLIALELAGIARVKSAKSFGVRTGNSLSVRQAHYVLNADS